MKYFMVTNDGDVVDLDQEIAQVIVEQGLRGDYISVIKDVVNIQDAPYNAVFVLYHVGTKQIIDLPRRRYDNISYIRDELILYSYEVTTGCAVVDLETGKVIEGDMSMYEHHNPHTLSWTLRKELDVYQKMCNKMCKKMGTGTIENFKKVLEKVDENSDHHLLPYMLRIFPFNHDAYQSWNRSPNHEFIAFQKKDLSIEVIYTGEEKDDGLCKGALN